MTAALILKRGKFSRSSGQWKDEDYDVLAHGKVIGRILEEGSRFGPPELRWGWSLFIVPARLGVTSGTAATREEAMAKFQREDESQGGRLTHRVLPRVAAAAPVGSLNTANCGAPALARALTTSAARPAVPLPPRWRIVE
jgi:hypothetical protein